MGPDVQLSSMTSDKDSIIAEFDKSSAVSKLSPLSHSRRKTLLAPTKQSLQDYDKTMVSSEQSVRKALVQLDKTIDTLEAAEEQRLEQERRPSFSVVVLYGCTTSCLP